MSDTTLETPHVLGSGDSNEPRSAASAGDARPFWLRHIWWLVGVALILVSALIVRWTNTRPGYDPYGWLIWGYQTLHLHLDLGGAPSWKPLPLLFTAPYSLFGHYAMWLWMVTGEAAAFAGTIFAGRIAYRVVDRNGRYRNAAIAAAVFAGLGMYGIQDNINGTLDSYMHYVFSVQSDPMIVTLVLAAIDMHMLRHRRWVLFLLGLAALGRPEVWPVLGLYMLWCWFRRPDMRLFMVVEVLVIAFLWFGIPTITNGRPLVAGDLAQGSPRECTSGKIICTIDRYKTLNLWPVWVFTLGAIGWAGYEWRKGGGTVRGWMNALAGRDDDGTTAAADGTTPAADGTTPAADGTTPAADGTTAARPADAEADEKRTERDNQLLVLGLAACIVIWLIVEIAFALHGWPAVPRYIFEPAVAAILLAGIAFGWVLSAIPDRLKLPRWAGVTVAVVLSLALIPGALARIRNEHKDIRHERIRTASIGQLSGIINRLGGREAILRCGRPVTNVEYVSILGWLMHQNDGKVGHRPQFELHQKYPIVLFTQLPNGWATYAWHTAQSKVASCQKMNAVYAVTKAHPNGVMVQNRIPPKPIPSIPNTPTAG